MKRNLHKNEIINKVLDVSRDLFTSQGYAETKIQQIVSGAGITTGSLYHFFRNKEDILAHLVGEIFNEAARFADGEVDAADDPSLRFALEIAVQLHSVQNYKKIAEIYLVAYGSGHISKRIIEMATERNRKLFGPYSPAFEQEDFYVRSLAVKGILHSFIDEYLHFNRLEDATRIDCILKLVLQLFSVPDAEISQTIEKTSAIIRSSDINICGYRL